MKFRSGKYTGYTVEQVRIIAPWYINWIRENRPEMLKERVPKKPKPAAKRIEPPEEDGRFKIQPNLDFENEWAPSEDYKPPVAIAEFEIEVVEPPKTETHSWFNWEV